MKSIIKAGERFLLEFWRGEKSQVTKVTVMSIASVVGVLSIAMFPLLVQSVPCPCSPCGPYHSCDRPNCQWSETSRCSGEAGCGSGAMYYCLGGNWECGGCPPP